MQAVVLLSDLLSAARVKVPLSASTKDDLLEELVGLLVGDGCAEDPAEVLRVVREREAILSTGIGSGVAIPHGKTPACSGLAIAAGVTRDPIDFDALDGEPVRIIFLLVGPETAAGAHIKALSRISRIVRQQEMRQRLMDAGDAGEFIRVLQEAERA
ncbi:MAG: PTS sugar transporter subunit IIA [Gemmatimonadetes bacterium]|nr:PTS sugar transporter subunit IIA [Gemmatimonadota bacterium]